jgi:hypothetical protein
VAEALVAHLGKARAAYEAGDHARATFKLMRLQQTIQARRRHVHPEAAESLFSQMPVARGDLATVGGGQGDSPLNLGPDPGIARYALAFTGLWELGFEPASDVAVRQRADSSGPAGSIHPAAPEAMDRVFRFDPEADDEQ